jgi:DNA mismatch endonuclease, patch repair protein
MTDTFSRQKRSQIMARIRSIGNTATELRFIQILRTNGIKGWRRHVNLPGHPDFVFRKARLVVFVDGDFWHGNPRRFRLPKSNCGYWAKKISSNRGRDRKVNRELRRRGWIVARFWQSSLKNERLVIRRLTKCTGFRNSGHAFPILVGVRGRATC